MSLSKNTIFPAGGGEINHNKKISLLPLAGERRLIEGLNGVIACSERYLEPVYERLKTRLLEESNLHADETVVQVLREPGRDAKTKSYEWLYRTGTHTRRKIASTGKPEARNTRRRF